MASSQLASSSSILRTRQESWQNVTACTFFFYAPIHTVGLPWPVPYITSHDRPFLSISELPSPSHGLSHASSNDPKECEKRHRL